MTDSFIGNTVSSGGRATKERLTSLDGLRGFASLYVITAHLFPLLNGNSVSSRIARAIVDLGWSGVDLFFVLSGFLITGILLNSRSASPSRYFGAFYARRFLRVFPVYYLLLVGIFVVVPRIPALARLNGFWIVRGSTYPYWAYLSNWPQLPIGIHRILCVCWSLAIEEQYYIVWPLTVWLVRPRTLGVLSLLLFLQSAFLRSYLVHHSGFSGTDVYHMTFTHLDGIALGSAIAVAWADRDRFGTLVKKLAALAPVLGIALIVVVVIAGVIKPHGADISYTSLVVHMYWLVGLFYASLLVRSLEPGVVQSVFATRFLRLLGKYSYAAYLFQFLAGWFVDVGIAHAHARFHLIPGLSSQTGLFVKFLIQVLATYSLAALSWTLIEGPINSYKDRARLLRPIDVHPDDVPVNVTSPGTIVGI